MAPLVEEFQINLGAITANQAAGIHLDSYVNSFGRNAYIDWVLVDNRSEATLELISMTSRPDILGGERKHIDLPGKPREVFLQANGTVTSGDVRITVGVVR